MLVRLPLLLIFVFIGFGSTYEVRKRRSVAPFLGAGGSKPAGMMIPQELWHCGSDSFSRNFTYDNTAADCPSLAAALNHCCAVHDDCYGQQNGQKKCDEEFCECNRMVTRLPTSEGEKCRTYVNTACFFLDVFGGYAYDVSKYATPGASSGVEPIAPKTAPSLHSEYLNMYSMCPYVNITLASCAINFDLCSDVHSPDFCSNDLCHCMLDAAESDKLHAPNCTNAVAETCRSALLHSSALLGRKDARRIYVVCAILLLCFLTTGSIGAVFWYKSEKRTQSVEEGKYLHIHTVESSRSVNPLLENTD